MREGKKNFIFLRPISRGHFCFLPISEKSHWGRPKKDNLFSNVHQTQYLYNIGPRFSKFYIGYVTQSDT